MDWSAIVKPFFSSSAENLSKTDTLNIVKNIIQYEYEILEHDASFKQFFDSFVVLSAENITTHVASISQTQLPQITEATNILIKYILKHLDLAPTKQCNLLMVLRILCEGKNGTDTKIIASTLLKHLKYPEHGKSSTNVTSTEKDSPKSEMKRSRSDLSTVILQQLTNPLGNGVFTFASLSEEQLDCTELFCTSNIQFLQANNAGDTILEWCTGSLSTLLRYRSKYDEYVINGKPLYLASTSSEATTIKNSLVQIESDISNMLLALSCPVIEPLSPKRISLLSQCAMSALYCGVLTATANSILAMYASGSQKTSSSGSQPQATTQGSSQTQKDTDEEEDLARIVVDKALEIFTKVGSILKWSTRTHIYQNHVCMGAWLLITGIQGAMSASATTSSSIAPKSSTEENIKGKSPSKTDMSSQQTPARVNLFKVQQGFGVLNAAVARHSLTLMTALIEDLKIDPKIDEEAYSNVEPAGFDIHTNYTAIQRIVRVLNSSTLQQLMTFLATVSYRKACTLKRINTKSTNEGDPISYSDSTTYFNDTFSCSDDSQDEPEEEDSDSYLGLWFKETLSPEANEDVNDNVEQEKKDEKRHGCNMVPAKDEPHEYLNLSAQIFTFFDVSLGGNHAFLHKYVKSGLTEQQMMLMANILKDLDRDSARGEPDSSGCLQWQNAMVKFSGSVGRYLHNLISSSLLNESLQSALLLHLGVSPWTQDSNIWPLQVYSRTLAVLVQILLLKPSQEKEAACLSVWHRLVNTLVDGVCSTQSVPMESEIEDLNVEHAQLLLFLFHSLNLMQKKSILLLTAGGVIRCAEVCRNVTPDKPLRDHQIMLVSRLLLFLEYLMKHLYNPPNILLEQVRWNLFSVFTLDNDQKISDLINYKAKMLSFCRKDIEDKHRKLANEFNVGGVKPKFYSLTTIDTKVQQEFKLDGLAWNFILCTPDKLKYPLLIDALIDILSIADMCLGKIPFQTMCAVHYCFSLTWKLLLGLPPSTQHVEYLMQERIPNLHSLLWAIRCLHPITHSHYLIVNSLVKQGMYTQAAENMWTKLTDHVSDIKYSLKMTLMGLNSFASNFTADTPRLSKIILLDSIVSHLYAICWAEKEGVNIKAKPNNTSTASANTTTIATDSVSSIQTISLGGIPSPQSSQTSVATSSTESAPEAIEVSREDLSKTLMLKLLDVLQIVKDTTYKTMFQNLSGQIPASLIEPLIAICSSKNNISTDLSLKLVSLITGQDKDVITVEWRKNLHVATEDNFTSGAFPVEIHTLTVVEAHLVETSKHLSYTILLSLKNTLKSILNLVFHMLPNYEDESIDERLKEILIPMLFDLRAEYLYDTVNKCLEKLIGGDPNSENYQLLAYTSVLTQSYKFLTEYTELSLQGKTVNIEETVLHNIIKFWESMLEKPIGLKAMREFFYDQKKGNLVQILLSFSCTTLSQKYSTKVLQFFEKLFQASEKIDASFSLDEVCTCISELGNIEPSKLKNWLSHILLGPKASKTSNNSSNVPTPTNMATVSQVPSITDQIAEATNANAEAAEAMDIDYELSAWQPVPGSTTNRSGNESSNTDEVIEKNGKLLQSLTKYIVSENRISANVSAALFQALVQIGHNLLMPANETLEFSDLLQVMITLADAGKGKGHALLFTAAIDWLDVCRTQILECKNQRKTNIQIENATAILRYMNDLLIGLGSIGSRSNIPPWDEESPFDVDDILDDLGGDDEDSGGEDSDEDSLSNKLCTFSITQKEFMNQHWYYCHTCKMVDGVGVCSVCARVCHKNHDISYAKYGNFFCDCGAKEDGSCLALSRRNTSAHQDDLILGSIIPKSSDPHDIMLPSSLRRRASSPTTSGQLNQNISAIISEKGQLLAKIIESSKEALGNTEQWKSVVKLLLSFFNSLLPSIRENCDKFSTVGCHLRAKNALERLHQPEKSYSFSDQIMVATLGSQEGAFENVRMNYSGDQGQTIKQLLTSNLVRRVALCCLASPHGKRQQLAVSHEKGKVTILQLSALLKQADAAKKKLTLTRLASAPIPCTVLSLASNPANEDFLAVCGLKECHVLTFSSTGTANEHIVLTPQLETGNFIKRAIWLPGSQTKLALVTADFVKIYELSEDSYSPQYYFLVPSGKIRDCTFVFQEDGYYMLIMSSLGYIYTQPLCDESLAKHGAFYVTNTLELDHPSITDDNGQILAGGVSIYYSHVLQMLFFSYAAGRNFMAPLSNVSEGVKCVVNLISNPASKVFSKSTTQPLCQWTEIAGHPGLICAMMQNVNNPVIFMIKPDGYVAQEIKAQNAKAKIMDMVAIRHSASGTEKTTLILLCEDGSLRIYAAHSENTGYWLSPEVQPISSHFPSGAASRYRKSKKMAKQAAGAMSTIKGIGSTPVFPIDFFEHSTLMTEVEYGGNDLLQIYNTQHLKHRLNSTGLYVTSTRANGFTLEVINNDPNMVMTGFRVSIGSQDSMKAPTNVTVYGRTVTTICQRPRWFDIPMTREESLQSDKKLCIHFGPSQDPEQVNILDSIKIYGKTKDAFGWPEESDEVPASSISKQLEECSSISKQLDECSSGNVPATTPLDKMTSTMLQVLDSGLCLLGGSNIDDNLKLSAIDVASTLILYPTANNVQQDARSVLVSLHPSKAAYHAYKDKEILGDVDAQLKVMSDVDDYKTIDPEAFYRIVLMIRGIAIQRPHALNKICSENDFNILPLLMKLTKELYKITSAIEEPMTIVKRGLSHPEAIIYSLVEIIYGFALSDQEMIESMTKFFVELLLDPAPIISHSAKQAMIKLLRPKIKRRKVLIESPPVCSTPTPSTAAITGTSSAIPSSSQVVPTNEDFAMQEVDSIESLGLEAGGNRALASLEALLGVAGLAGVHNVDTPDADDEAIMEIAIALSLQDNDGDGIQSLHQRLVNFHARTRNQAISATPFNEGTGTSGGSDDDEISNLATEGSTMRTSPAEPVGSGSAGSECSGVESIGGTSGRSSTYDDQTNPSPTRNSGIDQLPIQSTIAEKDEDAANEIVTKLHVLRYSILNKLVENFATLDGVSGAQCIPFMQVVLMLTSDLDGSQDADQNVMNRLLQALVDKLEIPTTKAYQMSTRNAKSEVQLIILRLVGILMGKVKSKSSSLPSTSATHHHMDNASFVASTTANYLMKNSAIPYCLVILESFLPHWKNIANNEELAAASSTAATVLTTPGGAPTNNLLKPTIYGLSPDMQPFFARQYVKGCNDVFELYPQVLTEMAVRLPYQILKLSTGHPSSFDWYHSLCEYMTNTLCEYMMYMTSPTLKRQVRKLLLFICGNKEKYRQLRDLHSLDTHMKAVKKCCDNTSPQIATIGSSTTAILSYDALVELTEHFRACQEIASIRTGNWQKFCILHSDILSSLLNISCYQLDEAVSTIILQLLQSAICNTNNVKPVAPIPMKMTSLAKDRKDRDKSEESDTATESKFDPAQCAVLVAQIFTQVSQPNLTKFIKSFLLETNSTSIRWQSHSLVYAFYENSNETNKEQLLECLWGLWPLLPAYGKRTAQFVDLLGYLTLNTKSLSDKLPDYTAQAVSVLRQQNELLSRHPNAPIYTALGQVLEVEGFYLESEPCLVCNNPDIPMSNIKLSSIKVDSKFTTTTTIVKLIQSHTISKIILRIADLKRAKMIRTINIYYNNRTVQAIVELKNRPQMWHKARKVTLQSGQTDVKIEFSLPITACNLMIEYADFYETVTGSESLQCPRCSAVVPANPGVCGNCGENVFQCHKCRAINYDEKDGYQCTSCGYCKYAKFDYSIFGRACCAVDPIESSEDRGKTIQTIHTSLEKADRSYRTLQANKQILELLVVKVAEHKVDRTLDETLIGSVVGTSQVNKVIQLLAQKYCVESKSTFEELSKIIQKVQACRRELVAYDRSQMDLPVTSSFTSDRSVAMNKCYGCALASTEQCLTLLRAMASNMPCRIGLCKQGLVQELALHNLRRGTNQIQDEVRNLLCLLTRDLPDATLDLCRLLKDRVQMALSGTVPLANMDAAVRHEMTLLEAMAGVDDSCWEQKLKTVIELFLNASRDVRGPAVAVIQPCLRIVQSLICPPLAISKANKDMTTQELCTIIPGEGITVDYAKWINGDPNHSFTSWKARQPPMTGAVTPRADDSATQKTFKAVLEHKRMQIRSAFLFEKYGKRWRTKVLSKGVKNQPLELTTAWLQPVLFNTNSRLGRQLACALVTSLSRSIERKREILDLLTSFLKYIGETGEASAEFITLYRTLANETPWRQYLALKGVLTLIADLLTDEIEKIHRLEETTLSSDLAQGYALRQLVELMSMFLETPLIRKAYKGKLLGSVLQGYLNLRKLVVQRTRLIDDAQEKLLEMLEEMTTGTEEETAAFMSVCIDTVRKTPTTDIKTPVFMFERLCSIIHPEENDVGEFFLTLEKDPQQEDFLQGRMLGNPYPSNEPGLGPLMRDVKNKICIDCELVALLEDDNGMELLVHNKIISLDLPVKEVYKKVWLQEGGERDAMRVVYRMRGLLGDATEEFIETLNDKSKEEVDNEHLYRMANVLADCGGLKVMLDRIGSLQNVSKSRTLLQVLLKLFLLSVKVRRCQEVLCQPELGAINTLLRVLQLCLQSESDTQQSAVTEQLLEIMETILSKAASDTLDSFLQFSLTFGGPEYVQALLSCTNCPNVRNSPSVLRHLIRVLAALVYGNDIKMALLCDHFKEVFNFDKFDNERTSEDEFKMELFCVLTTGIEHNSIGGILKDYIMSLSIVDKAIDYIKGHAPCVKPTLLRTDSDELKEFISRASLKYILRFLTGLATKHEATQLSVAQDIIPIIHRLEQVSSDEHVGSLAENLLEALCTEPSTAKRVQEVRDFTRAEKKRLAMATREKQLDALGMRTNEKGQVTAKGSILQQIDKLKEETGLACFICREGYACQPNKVLGIYTFTKRANVEEFEMKPKKTVGYATVTHFNIVHVDCHMSAIRLARSRDEWESASLQNANTRCNGLLPLWGPDVSESSFSSCMARHNNYMQESTQRCEITFSSSIHDFKLLLLRFAQEKSFHEDAGGGGPQSNMHLVPYLLFYGIYILLSSRSYSREEKTLSSYLAQAPCERWLECAYEVEGPLYQLTISLALHTPEIWNKNRLQHMKRLLVIGHVRNISPSASCKFLISSDKEVKDYSVYKPYLMIWALVDLIYKNFFRTVTTPKDEDWPISLFDYIRRNDEAMLKSTNETLETFSEEYLPAASFGEFCDVAGLLNDIEDPDNFLANLLQALPSSTLQAPSSGTSSTA